MSNHGANLFELSLVTTNREHLARAFELTHEARDSVPKSDLDYPFLPRHA